MYKSTSCFVVAAPHLSMSITFRNKADIVLWVFARLIEIIHTKLYWFAAQCVSWLAALIGLAAALLFYHNHDKFPLELVVLEARSKIDLTPTFRGR